MDCRETVDGLAQTASAQPISLLGVRYHHCRMADGSDLYLTDFGLPLREQLLPQNWYEPEWFAAKRLRLVGTSTIYRVPTKCVGGRTVDLVVRFSRVGEDVPDAGSWHHNVHIEFNSPFEEFAMVMDLRQKRPRILTKKPLAIFVPAERLQLWQTGRSESKIAAKVAQHPDVPLDILRQYIVLYGWIKGVNAVQAYETPSTRDRLPESFLTDVTNHAVLELERHGFSMADIKPEHILLRSLPDGSLLRRHSGELAHALVDYELLDRFKNE